MHASVMHRLLFTIYLCGGLSLNFSLFLSITIHENLECAMSSTAIQTDRQAERDQYSKDVPWYLKELANLSPACRELFENYSHVPPEEVNSHIYELVRLENILVTRPWLLTRTHREKRHGPSYPIPASAGSCSSSFPYPPSPATLASSHSSRNLNPRTRFWTSAAASRRTYGNSCTTASLPKTFTHATLSRNSST